MKKRPNLVRQVMNYPDGRRFTLAFDGTQAWQMQSTQRKDHFELLDYDANHPFLRDAELENPLAAEVFDKRLMKYHGIVKIEGNINCHYIEVNYPDGSNSHFYIDEQTFLERKTVKEQPTEDGTMEVTEVFPSDFRFHNGVLFSHRLIIRPANGPNSLLEIDSIRINAGVSGTFFKPPPGEAKAVGE
jgi:hypothetical protein